MSFLVDTNVLSELARPAPAPAVASWAAGLAEMSISVVTLEEIAFGLASKPNGRVQRWLDTFVGSYCRTLDVTPEIARHAGILRGQHARRGRARTQADMLIAATAAQHGLTLATRNARDFDGCGVALVDPFATATR